MTDTMPGDHTSMTASVAQWLDDIRCILDAHPTGPVDDAVPW